jgi:GT2 family glycosyltransferase
MISSPVVSVMIPCYNQANHIAEVIEAVLHQSRLPEEIIVVDDASLDKSPGIISTLPVILVRHEKNLGLAATRNSAFLASHGDILIFIDSDACADPHLLERILEIYAQDETGKLGGVGGKGIEMKLEGLADLWRSLHGRQDWGAHPLANVEYLFGLCCTYRREAFERVNGFDPFFIRNAGEDFDIGLRMRKMGYRLAYTPDGIVNHQHSDTLESLKSVQYNWTFCSYFARRRNKMDPWRSFIGPAKVLFQYALSDLIMRRDVRLFKLDCQIAFLKIKALRDAYKVFPKMSRG